MGPLPLTMPPLGSSPETLDSTIRGVLQRVFGYREFRGEYKWVRGGDGSLDVAPPPSLSLSGGDLPSPPSAGLTHMCLQEWAVKRVLSGRSSLVVAATGTGKSLCYQLPALLTGGVEGGGSPLSSPPSSPSCGINSCTCPGASLEWP